MMRGAFHAAIGARMPTTRASAQPTASDAHAQIRAPRTIAPARAKARAIGGGPPFTPTSSSATAAAATTAATGPGKRRAAMSARGPTAARPMVAIAVGSSGCAIFTSQIDAGICTRALRTTGTQRRSRFDGPRG